MKLNNRTSSGRGLITLVIGALVLVAGLWATYVYSANAMHTLEVIRSNATTSFFPTIVLPVLWLVAAAMVAVAGFSLLVSGLMRRRHNLIPGPTLYLLGLSIIGIGIHFLAHHQLIPGAVATVAGLVICYWEFAFDVS